MIKKTTIYTFFAATFMACFSFAFATTGSLAYASDGAQMDVSRSSEGTASLASATSVKGATTEVELGTGIVGTKKFTVNQKSVRDTALTAVIKWRKDALNDTNIKFNGKTVKEYLKTLGISESTYLNPSWSNALERIAMQRAIEAGDSTLGHTRPNGTSCSTATCSGVSAAAEILAWGSGYAYTGTTAVDQWASEKSEYIKECKGQSHKETGHYKTLVDPSYKAYGFAIADGYNYEKVAAGEAGKSLQGSASATNWVGSYSFDMAISNDIASKYGVYVNLYSKVQRINIGQTYDFVATLGYRNSTLTVKEKWYSDNPSVLQMQTSGTAKALKAGTVNIYFLGQNSLPCNLEIIVPSNIELSRIYNPNSGEHFYTQVTNEREKLVLLGWIYEGIGWSSPKSSKTPVYRVYNPNAGDHHYTTSKKEYDWLKTKGWIQEGVSFYSDDNKSVVVYRQYNPNAKAGAHNFTTSKNENDFLVGKGWIWEGYGWYGVK